MATPQHSKRPGGLVGAIWRSSYKTRHLSRRLIDRQPISPDGEADVSGWLRWKFVEQVHRHATDLWVGVEGSVELEMLILFQILPAP